MPLLFAACPTRSLVRLLLFPLLILLSPVASAGPRQKTDVIELRNGDRVTGEIKKLD